MDRKERILNYISSDSYIPLKFREMVVVLDVPESETDELTDILNELISEGKIYLSKRGRYCPVGAMNNTFSGTLSCNAAGGFGFVRCDDESLDDIFVAFENLGNAYDRDKVLVKILNDSDNRGHAEGRITQIIERCNKKIVGVVTEKKAHTFYLSPDRREFFSRIRIKQNDLNGASVGDRVLAEIDYYDEKGKPYGQVLSVLGSSESILSNLNGMIAENLVSTEFPKSVLDEADAAADFVPDEELSGREDLRNKIIFTIDGDDSRDFDDAVSLEKNTDGNYLLGVHIADVTHYVKDASELDKEAKKRATSVYFPHKVIPMLPKKLSNGICSLNPDTDRLTLSVFMEIDSDGNIHNHRISETVIHSVARMTYNNVNKILAGDTKLCDKYSSLVPVLQEMNTLAKKLSEKRRERGAIDFDFPETKVICDEDANPIDVKIDDRGDSHKLIESFMLAANETVAEAAYWAELPFVYRVHESPSNEKLTAFNEFIKNFGYSLKGKLDSDSIHPKDLQTIAEAVKGKPEELMISKVMLQSLMKAGYRDTNNGHFGLAARYYCHFTSPIRRYPDLMIHRVLKDFISGNLNESRLQYYESKVSEVAQISSEREIEAEKAERDAVDLLKTAYMSNYLGESFEAVISSVTSFGMFATLANSCEGLIRCETMTNDYYEYNETTHQLVGKRSGRIYKIGDIIRITVASCNVLMRRVDFVLEEDAKPHVFAMIKKRTRKVMSLKDEKHKKFKRKRRR